ncbi:MAG: aminotransferase class I/II-fold pyridoxal phosphate-dependent enzyme [Pedobacter sp.]|nr:aminotransferase class I/II-fold pyridoxal phosphate-dependent enzyme [Pedobacter sp.]MDQ8054327.1 aminotransferase class I/II-fold pyridoxal phosphate-dependent enzyme [Pedobacter sp.]
MINFSSENFDGVHPQIMAALAQANQHFVASYGNDPFTQACIQMLKSEIGDAIDVYFTFNGTGANNFGFSCVTERYQSIFCSDVAHCYVDESTAPETLTGCRLYPILSVHGKIKFEALRKAIKRKGDVHHPQGGILTLTQPTEYGTVYTLEELQNIGAFCRMNGILLHVDGARFFNAAAALDASLAELTMHVDLLTLGGTKMGMMYGEAVIFLNALSNHPFKFMHKRSMQLASKNRFISAQFQELLNNRLWKEIASHTNELAKFCESEILKIGKIEIAHPVETNMVFLKMNQKLYKKMQEHVQFYDWDQEKEEVRLVFSFSHTKKDVNEFVHWLNHFADNI